jgi:hypothetical protein
MTDSQFMVQMLDSLTNDYESQMILMEKRIGNKQNPLTIDEIREELSLRYDRLSLVSETTNDIDLTKEKTLFTTQFKGKCRNYRNKRHKAIDCKDRREQPSKG